MRLFEVDDSAREVLAVFQGQANRAGKSSTLPFATVMNLLKSFDLGISTPNGLIALKNAIDPAGDVIDEIQDDGTVILKTKADNPNKDQAAKQPAGPSVEKMASSNAKTLSPKI
jgi:hypothetical protein